jgi:hypothetical protein
VLESYEQAVNALSSMTVAAAAQQAFHDCQKYALFDESGQVLASNFQV